ncbi:hypothetical protein C265_14427 [Cupriavidus sp. GA3-3]|uniref:hypothetical protein n=1 Tax=Cupriavidus TaxID=106589 RepID=UPI000330655D|nr:hypothetical protein [Cupriavidus sp. GA3-3]EON19032.1 hypothetical protein C265_14427 [Cupriavidus sp. GA3-3]
MHAEDMIVSVRQRKLACILDPALVLGSPWGPSLALRLTRVLEPWLTRAFWQVIDASEMVLPSLSANGAALDSGGAVPRPLEPALIAWIAMRDCTDAASWPFRWVGDNVAGSQLGDAADHAVVERYEVLLDALLRRCEGARPALGPMPSPWWDPLAIALDTLALSATLDAAIVLTTLDGDGAPWPVHALWRSGVDVRHLDPLPSESLFGAERSLLRDALAAAGVAGLAERLPRLAALHVMASSPHHACVDGPLVGTGHHADPWQQATAWWYPLCPTPAIGTPAPRGAEA